jgi:hypothetical protein
MIVGITLSYEESVLLIVVIMIGDKVTKHEQN